MTDQPEKAGHIQATTRLLALSASDMAAEIERLREDQSLLREIVVERQEEIDRLRAQRDRLLEALNLTMIGGNHLANVLIGRLGGGFAAKYPPDLDHEIALRKLGATDEYDVWCCWAAIMTARAVANQDANSKVKG